MFFPKKAQYEPVWIKGDKVMQRCSTGSEYLNTSVPLVSSVFKCNHDATFLTAAEGPEKAYFMMKYATKDQHSVENPLAIHLHDYDKVQLRLAECDSAVAGGRRCMQSMCCFMSNAHDVSASLAALYLDRSSSSYFSVEFHNIHVWPCVEPVFKSAPVEVILSQNDKGSDFHAASSYVD
ncbi:hypothetical protein JG688_00000899 [Phytophthora aleatoria]|uniref:Uncharacterized protein n=1 Tax=Phytophthora aleatoria TaxID=2496075 RepID=A0A8J5J148_9STRA|nr:hypothetical protein JG688_00000899 [Phytophthora aleatoria]